MGYSCTNLETCSPIHNLPIAFRGIYIVQYIDNVSLILVALHNQNEVVLYINNCIYVVPKYCIQVSSEHRSMPFFSLVIMIGNSPHVCLIIENLCYRSLLRHSTLIWYIKCSSLAYSIKLCLDHSCRHTHIQGASPSHLRKTLSSSLDFDVGGL